MKPSQRTIFPALAILLLAAVAEAADPPHPGYINLPIASGVSVLQGYESNILVSAGEDGIVLVDAGDERVVDKLLEAVKKLSSKPIRFVIDTHVHGDHSGGNAVLQKLAPVIAADNVRARMMSTGDDKAPAAAWPVITYDGEMTLHLNGEEIRILKIPAGHTDGDSVVFFSRANVIHMGDAFMAPGASFGTKQSGGSMLGLIESLEFVLPRIPADAKIIPGHGQISTRADIVRGLDALKGMRAEVERGIREGKTQQQLIAEKPLDKWKGSVPAWISSMDSFVREFYQELTAKP